MHGCRRHTEGHEALGEEADCVLTAAWLSTKGGMDATSGGAVTGVAFVGTSVVDEAREGFEPEGAIESALGEQRAVDERCKDVALEESGCPESVTLVAQTLQSDVAGLASKAE